MLPLAVTNGRSIFGCEGEAANGANRVAIVIRVTGSVAKIVQ